jgi:hypothetical protein
MNNPSTGSATLPGPSLSVVEIEILVVTVLLGLGCRALVGLLDSRAG